MVSFTSSANNYIITFVFRLNFLTPGLGGGKRTISAVVDDIVIVVIGLCGVEIKSRFGLVWLHHRVGGFTILPLFLVPLYLLM